MSEFRSEFAQLAAAPLEELTDAADRLQLGPVLIPGVSALWSVPAVVVGTAVTVELAGAGYPARTTSHLGTAAIDNSDKGQIVVVDHGGRTDCAGWGGLLSEGAALRGLAATVVYGAIRDVTEAQSLDYPVFGLGYTPISARARAVEKSSGETILCGPVVVNPGDVVVASRAGTLVLPAMRVDDVLEVTAQIRTREQSLAVRMRAGENMSAVLDVTYESMLDNDHK